MARIKMQDLTSLTKDELTQKLLELKKELFALQSQKATGTLEKPGRIGIIRKDIARILTILKETELKNAKKS